MCDDCQFPNLEPYYGVPIMDRQSWARLQAELAALRALREAVETYFGKYPFSDIGNIVRALAACDEASAVSTDEHTK